MTYATRCFLTHATIAGQRRSLDDQRRGIMLSAPKCCNWPRTLPVSLSSKNGSPIPTRQPSVLLCVPRPSRQAILRQNLPPFSRTRKRPLPPRTPPLPHAPQVTRHGLLAARDALNALASQHVIEQSRRFFAKQIVIQT